MQSESSIQKAILKLLNARDNVWAVKTITTNRNGTPDIIASVGGHFVAIEVKTAKGAVAPLQTYQINLINQTGGTAIVARSTQEVKDMLTALDKMALIDEDVEQLAGVDPAIANKLADFRDVLGRVKAELRDLLWVDEISDADIRQVLKIIP